MAKPDFYADREAFDAAVAEYNELRGRIPRLEEEWCELTEQNRGGVSRLDVLTCENNACNNVYNVVRYG